ncbi:uncharacterized protein EV422DRAFT_596752 [Fimicolochytrium jonesii]|uniref:uncharacterized protein n=1 Tax=Fimicolochytrium jonesii TaxID=1396493 RepID=UPI0022FDCEC2|nr:uncharacterized protein EV422DRAFT_596752 [Fimicolochytrium jonesii]KAI8820537.1 hypothetical protein EV422DRAFT_596752 [Fimicolochytrium jonesii]
MAERLVRLMHNTKGVGYIVNTLHHTPASTVNALHFQQPLRLMHSVEWMHSINHWFMLCTDPHAELNLVLEQAGVGTTETTPALLLEESALFAGLGHIVNNVKTARAACNKCGRAQAYLDAIAALPGKPVVPSTTLPAPAPATTHLTHQPPVSAHHPPVSTIPTPITTAQPPVSAAAPPVSAPQPPVAAAAPTAPIPNPLAFTSLLNPAPIPNPIPISALLNPAPIPTCPTRAAAIAGVAAAAAAAAAPTPTTGDEEEGYDEMAQEELAAIEEEEGHWRALGKLVRETCGSTIRQAMKAHTTPLFDAHRARLAAAKQKAEEVQAFTPASDDADDDDEEYTSVESSLPHSYGLRVVGGGGLCICVRSKSRGCPYSGLSPSIAGVESGTFHEIGMQSNYDGDGDGD